MSRTWGFLTRSATVGQQSYWPLWEEKLLQQENQKQIITVGLFLYIIFRTNIQQNLNIIYVYTVYIHMRFLCWTKILPSSECFQDTAPRRNKKHARDWKMERALEDGEIRLGLPVWCVYTSMWISLYSSRPSSSKLGESSFSPSSCKSERCWDVIRIFIHSVLMLWPI